MLAREKKLKFMIKIKILYFPKSLNTLIYTLISDVTYSERMLLVLFLILDFKAYYVFGRSTTRSQSVSLEKKMEKTPCFSTLFS